MVTRPESILEPKYQGTKYEPDLFTNQCRLPNFRIRIPFAEEKLAKEWVERFLLAAKLLAATAVLLVKGAEEPLENQQGSLLGVRLFRRSYQNIRMFSPVGGVFGQGGRGEDERWGSQRRQVTVEGRNGLRITQS